MMTATDACTLVVDLTRQLRATRLVLAAALRAAIEATRERDRARDELTRARCDARQRREEMLIRSGAE